MSEELDKQEEIKPLRNELGQLLPGNTANPKGRPKGKTLKEFARDFLMSMTDEQKETFLNSLSKDVVWKMAEGNPHQSMGVSGTITEIKVTDEQYKDIIKRAGEEPDTQNTGEEKPN